MPCVHQSNTLEQTLIGTELKNSEKNRKHNNPYCLLSVTYESSTSDQSLIRTELEDGEKNLKHSKSSNY